MEKHHGEWRIPQKAARILAVLLAVSTMIPLAACGQAGDETEGADKSENGVTDAVTEGETARLPFVGKADYGKDFQAIYCPDTYREGYYFVKDEDRVAGNDLDDRVYERMLRIKDYLGVTIVPVNGGNFQEYGGVLKKSVKAQDDEYQMVMTHVGTDVVPFVTGHFLRDFDDFDNLNREADYWNANMMDGLAIGDHHFCGYNDFCLAQCNLFLFNKGMADEYKSEIGNLYDTVRNHEWTLDRMMKTAAVAYKENGDGVRDTNDNYGITGPAWVQMISFQTGCGIDLVRRDKETNMPYISPMQDNKDKIVDLVHRLSEFSKQDCNAMWKNTTQPDKIVNFTDGHALLAVMDNFQMVTASRESVKFGVLPYPMYDEKQENYRTMSWNGVLGIPTTVQDEAMVGDTIEMLAFFSQPVKTAFFETLLKSKVADAPDDADMLNILWDTLVSDMGLTYSGSSAALNNLLYGIPIILDQEKDDYASFYQKNYRAADKGLKAMFKKLS